MLFNTIDFVLFLPVVIFLYFLTPQKYRWVLLLIASYYFYMSWKVEYIFLIVFSTLIDYFSGLKMEKLPDRKSRRPYLILSLVTNLGLLFAFKYYNFATGNLNLLFEEYGIAYRFPISRWLLPVGISFYTFQTLSYSIDVYYGRQKAEKHLGYFALYVSFFPQLVAGPIERFSRLTPQLKSAHHFSYENISKGLRLILYGLFIKMVIADNLSGIIDSVYAAPQNYNSADILKAIIFYSFQIYSDFYGYSLIAIGSALMMGIKLMDNFRTPYLAKNIAEFWQRWHISLSTWFRDYLYYPLGGNRVAITRWMLNIMIVFVVSGIWHGANWTFIIWGGLYGIVYLLEKLTNRYLPVKPDAKAFSPTHLFFAFKTFLFVSLIWIFFRSQSFAQAMDIFHYLFTNIHTHKTHLSIPVSTWIFLSIFILSDILLYDKRFDTWLDRFPYLFRWTVYAIMLFAIVVFAGVENFPFIYFQF